MILRDFWEGMGIGGSGDYGKGDGMRMGLFDAVGEHIPRFRKVSRVWLYFLNYFNLRHSF
jgi:hypothetical protein